MRVKIIIVALVIGLGWRAEQTSSEGDGVAQVPLALVAFQEGKK